MGAIAARTQGVREQVVTVVGGPGHPGSPGVYACEGRAPHGFFEQEAEVAVGIARFIRGGDYVDYRDEHAPAATHEAIRRAGDTPPMSRRPWLWLTAVFLIL